MRRKLPSIYESELNNLIQFFDNSKVSIICDETTDSMQRSVFQVILIKLDLKVDSSPKLIDTIFLECVNYQTVARSVLNSLIKMKINFENVISFTTDNATYMIKAFNTVLKPILFNATHITCFAHIIALVGETWRTNLTEVDSLVANLKSIFARGNLRKQRFKDFLIDNGISNPVSYPSPVVTRWNSWFKAVKYIAEHFDIIKKFIEHEVVRDNSAAVKKLDDLFTIDNIKDIVTIVADKCDKFKFVLLKFEEDSLSTCEVFNIVNDLYFWLIGQIESFENQIGETNARIALLFKSARDKLRKYLFEGSQPGM